MTISNSLNNPDYISKGQILIGRAGARPAMLGWGSLNGQVLACDSTTTSGFKYMYGVTGYYLNTFNSKNLGNTIFFTTPSSGFRFFPTHIIMSVLFATSITVGASISIGTNGSSYNNILANTAFTGLTTANNYQVVQLSGVLNAIPANTSGYLNVNTASIGTSITMSCVIVGTWSQ